MVNFKNKKAVFPFLVLSLLLLALFPLSKGLSSRKNYKPKAEVQQSSKKRTSLSLSLNKKIVHTNSSVRMETILKDDSNQPLANKKIVFTYDQGWNYGEYIFTDSQGRSSYSLSTANNINRTGFCGTRGSQNINATYTAFAYFQGDENNLPAIAYLDFKVASPEKYPEDSTPQTVNSRDLEELGTGVIKPPPTIYWGWDHSNFDPNSPPDDFLNNNQKISGQKSDYGPFGGIARRLWDELDENFSWFDNFVNQAKNYPVVLPDGQSISKPVILSVGFYNFEGDHTPQSVKDTVGGSYPLKPTGCPDTLETPKYCDPGWQEAYRGMVNRLGSKFDGKIGGVLISIGFDEEANITKNKSGCDYLKEIEKYCPYWSGYMPFLMNSFSWYRQAFPNTPIYLQGSPFYADKALSAKAGYKTNGWAAQFENWTYSNIALYKGESGVWYRNPSLPHAHESRWDLEYTEGFEEANKGIYSGTYWMLLNMLSTKPDFIDFHQKHWGAFLKIPWLKEFVYSQLQKKPGNSPLVYSVLREVGDSMRKELDINGCSISGVYGDYSFYLYRRENLADNATIPVKALDLPPETYDQPYTNKQTGDLVHESGKNVTNTYSARRTDQSSGNNFMSFDVDNGWQFSLIKPSEGISYRVSIIYLDKGSDKFFLEYKNEAGELKKTEIIKTNTNKWIKKDVSINDGYFNDQLEGQTDFRINNNQDGDEVIHLVQIWGQRGSQPPTPTATGISTIPTLTLTPTPPPTISGTLTPTPTVQTGLLNQINCPLGQLGNLNCDPEGKINELDLNIFKRSWASSGPVPTPMESEITADINHDGRVDETDLTILLQNWRE